MSSFIGFSSYATNFFDPIDKQFDMGEYLAENAYGFLPVPIIITEPALGYGGGFTGVFLGENDQQRERRKEAALASLDGGAQLLTPSITAVGGIVTENGTWLGFAGHQHSWLKDSIRYTVGGGYGRINMTYYPFGNDAITNSTLNDKGIELEMIGFGLMQNLQFRLADSHWLLGFKQTYSKPEIGIKGQDKLNEFLGKWLNLSPALSAVGLTLVYDSQNNFMYPTKGFNYHFSYLLYRDAVGSDYKYDAVSLVGKNFWELTNKFNLGVKLEFEALANNDSILPPNAYPYIKLRGIPSNRYQGEAVASLEGQFTWEIDNRWSTSIFAGIGSATGEASDLFSADNQYSYGAGFRYLIARRYGLRAGIDVAFSDNDSALYFNIGTGF
ncbi:glyceraldehyde-3-phosphate dehydrogenase [Colwellia sp. RSH04]|nr:glyceraldehyde-3-phosphate dehydrogenase [Colwellia sp. RSH04]